ncbi:MAG: sugar ABC transporter permease [Anaerolineae bacterium]|jgi:multiple sugar transport system permease protein|nr:sugar ABC transporter permease [Anaerolineae bacterium]
MRRTRERWFYLLISPWLAGFFLLQCLPIVVGLCLSLTDWNLTGPLHWAGAKHFLAAATDPRTHRALANTAKYVLGSVPLSLGLALALAIALNRTQAMAGNNALRTAIFLPSVMSGVAIAFVWAWLLDPRFGPLNAALRMIGISGPGWFRDAGWALPAMILLGVWGCGGAMMIYLAALVTLPRELYEAATLDGAGRLARFRFITFPLLSPVTFYLIVVALINAFQLFTPAYVITRGGPQGATLLTGLHMYLTGFQFGRFGEASALALFILAVTLVVTLVQFRLSGRWVHYEG